MKSNKVNKSCAHKGSFLDTIFLFSSIYIEKTKTKFILFFQPCIKKTNNIHLSLRHICCNILPVKPEKNVKFVD